MKATCFCLSGLLTTGTAYSIFKNGIEYALKLSVEVARHGERAPGKFFEGLIDGPGFEVGPKHLTKKGAESHYEIGKQLRQQFSESNFINVDEYNPMEVYILTTDKARAKHSAIAQMHGLYDFQFQFPLPAAHDFQFNTPSEQEDLILHARGVTCPRFEKVALTLEGANETIALYEELYAWIEEVFFTKLRLDLNMPDANTKQMSKVVDFIDWAIESDLKLNFDLSEQDLLFIELVDEVKQYTEHGA